MEASIEDFTKEEIETSIALLSRLVDHPEEFALITKDHKTKLMAILGKFSRPKSKDELKKRRKQRKRSIR